MSKSLKVLHECDMRTQLISAVNQSITLAKMLKGRGKTKLSKELLCCPSAPCLKYDKNIQESSKTIRRKTSKNSQLPYELNIES